jgi:RimJ/RimL family protein N-acetyltransferase
VVEVRRLREDDVERLVDLIVEVADERRWIATQPPVDRAARAETIRAGLADERSLPLVAEADGKLVGELSARLTPYGVVDFGMLVAPGWRGRGVGGALLAGCVEWARSVGAHKVSLQVFAHNDAAIALYRRFGFVEEGRLRRHYRRRDGDIYDAIVMGLPLDQES